ncbi:Uncharacterized protein APZ42_028136 [Daphnia magna]|uniref:Uncharacterized protein n=1 Tax=Daphnia magna TaxID=35525 RepID=A0A164QUW0_9CRUS|nr:Uncharacterized protein APZ42_028136 [Daphnia magna]
MLRQRTRPVRYINDRSASNLGINRVHSNVLPLPAHFIRIARRMTLAASQEYLHHKEGKGKENL